MDRACGNSAYQKRGAGVVESISYSAFGNEFVVLLIGILCR